MRGDMVNYNINQCEYSEGEGDMVNYSIDQCEYSALYRCGEYG